MKSNKKAKVNFIPRFRIKTKSTGKGVEKSWWMVYTNKAGQTMAFAVDSIK